MEEADAKAERGPPRLLPITSIDALLSWEPGLRPDDVFCRASVPLRIEDGGEDHSSPSQRVLACHDFKGGYGDDALACGVFHPAASLGEGDDEPSSSSLNSSPFRFTHWGSVDAFVYFSHELVTIPPPAWTDATHESGALCLGTLIFEHAAGLREAERAFGSAAAAEATARKLAELASWFGFDGWLFNVEVAFRREEGEGEGNGRGNGEGEGKREGVEDEKEKERTRALIENCLLCLRRTRELCRLYSSSPSSSLVLWYDAVTCDDGSLRWQNGLTPRNARFFAAADGIFTNYFVSASEQLRASARLAESEECGFRSAAEVWVGADAFGRGSFGGAGPAGVAAAAAAAARAGSSLAVFAPGWVLEAFEGQGEGRDKNSDDDDNDNNAWRARADRLWQGVDGAYRERRRRRKKKGGEGLLRLPLFSAFSTGAGRGWWSQETETEGGGAPLSSSRRVGGAWFHLGLADGGPFSPPSQRWGAVSVGLLAVPEEVNKGGEEMVVVRLSLVVAEAAVVRAGAGGGDCEVGGRCSRCRLASRGSLDGGGALAVAVSAFGPPLSADVAGASSSPPRERSVEFELFGDGGGEGEEGGARFSSSSSSSSSAPPGEEETATTAEAVAVKAWVLEEEEGDDAATASSAVSLSLVVRGGGGGSAVATAEQAPPPPPPPPSFLLPLDSAPCSPPSSPSSPSSSSCCWKRHEGSFPLRELGGSVSSVALRLTLRGGEGARGGGKTEAEEGAGGGGGGRPLFSATLGAVALVPSSFRPPESPVASWIALRGRSLEWGVRKGPESESDGGGGGDVASSKVKRWEVWRRGREGAGPSFLAATRARRWWVDSGGDEDDSLRRGDELFVRAVFADGGREAVPSEEVAVAVVE